MTIRNEDWSRVEQIARQHEIREHDHYLPVKPVPMPTQAQQLAFAVADLTRCKARIHRSEQVMAEAVMYLQLGETTRAKELLLKGWADL